MVFPVQHTASIRRHAPDLRAFDSVHVAAGGCFRGQQNCRKNNSGDIVVWKSVRGSLCARDSLRSLLETIERRSRCLDTKMSHRSIRPTVLSLAGLARSVYLQNDDAHVTDARRASIAGSSIDRVATAPA